MKTSRTSCVRDVFGRSLHSLAFFEDLFGLQSARKRLLLCAENANPIASGEQALVNPITSHKRKSTRTGALSFVVEHSVLCTNPLGSAVSCLVGHRGLEPRTNRL